MAPLQFLSLQRSSLLSSQNPFKRNPPILQPRLNLFPPFPSKTPVHTSMNQQFLAGLRKFALDEAGANDVDEP